MNNKQKYNNYFNKPADKPETPAVEINELDPTVVKEDESDVVNTPIVEEGTEKNSIIDDPIVEDDSGENDIIDDSISDETSSDESETKNVQKIRVVVPKLNIREEANKESKIIVEVKKDDLLELTETTSIDGFYKVKTISGQNGYCMVDFVELV